MRSEWAPIQVDIMINGQVVGSATFQLTFLHRRQGPGQDFPLNVGDKLILSPAFTLMHQLEFLDGGTSEHTPLSRNTMPDCGICPLLYGTLAIESLRGRGP